MHITSKKKIFIFFHIFFICFVAAPIFFTYAFLKKSNYCSKNNRFIVDNGRFVDNMPQLLVQTHITDSLFIAKFALRLSHILGYRPKIGEYQVPDKASIFEAIKIISSGISILHKFTIPEGFSVLQVIEKLNKNEFLSGEITEIPAEGSLMPATYYFKYPTTREKIILTAQETMQDFFQKAWKTKSADCPLKNPKDALILASIVEKETYRHRELVAGVYLRRLQIGMRLQSCPTVIYSLTKGKPLARKLLHRDLKINDPFNTYRYAGLPPTPITNPSKKSIMAVLHPIVTDCLFFVADGFSDHVFSKTFNEHKQNMLKMRKQLKKQAL
jgi:UPF0755 protein